MQVSREKFVFSNVHICGNIVFSFLGLNEVTLYVYALNGIVLSFRA